MPGQVRHEPRGLREAQDQRADDRPPQHTHLYTSQGYNTEQEPVFLLLLLFICLFCIFTARNISNCQCKLVNRWGNAKSLEYNLHGQKGRLIAKKNYCTENNRITEIIIVCFLRLFLKVFTTEAFQDSSQGREQLIRQGLLEPDPPVEEEVVQPTQTPRTPRTPRTQRTPRTPRAAGGSPREPLDKPKPEPEPQRTESR